MTRTRRTANLVAALGAATAILAPAALAQAVPVMTTSTSGATFMIDITGGRPNKSVWFLSLPPDIDHSILGNVFDAGAAGAQLAYTARTDAAGAFHISFPMTAVPARVEYAAYSPFGGAIRFLGTMLPNPGGVLEVLAIDGTEFRTGGPRGGPFAPASATFELSNAGTAPLAWSAAASASWMSLAPASGVLVPGQSRDVIATVSAAAATLVPGSYPGAITITNMTIGEIAAVFPARLGVGTTIENGRWLSVHGRPFIPIGVWNQPPWSGHVQYLRGLGINTYLNNGFGAHDTSNPGLMSTLAANDMWAIMQFDSPIMSHPRLLGWLMGDEPDLSNTPPAQVQADFNAIRAADPHHFIGLNLTGNFYRDANVNFGGSEATYQQYTDIPDVVSFDMYPVTGWNRPDWVYIPGAATGQLLGQYVDHAKPVWAIIEASDQDLSWTPPNTPGPTAAQMRFEVFDSIIHGATAIHYFTIAFNPFRWTNLTPAIEQELTRTNGQITALTDVILSLPPALNVTSSEASGRAHNFMVRQSGSRYWVFADNADMANRTASITFSFPRTVVSVGVYGEGRSITPSGNSFSDGFAALGVHIYEIELAP